ncbi:MAG: O-antigen ligase family protein [Flavobacteriales bacterium]|nr:O-antigen ligase family protein [Flavobacteriales bacterium]
MEASEVGGGIGDHALSEQSMVVPYWLVGLFGALVVSIPLSVKLYFMNVDLEVIVPAEVLIAVLAPIIGVMLLRKAWRKQLPLDLLRHPITVLFVAYMLSAWITALFSVTPLVSIKAMVVRSAYFLLFYAVFLFIPMNSAMRIRSLLLYMAAFFVVVVYVLVRQSFSGFDRQGASFVPYPFYTDHTVYAAALVFMLFLLGLWVFRPWSFSLAVPRSLRVVVLVVFAWALMVSFCRAAWISAAISGLVIVILKLRLRMWQWAAMASTLLLVTLAWRAEVRAFLYSEAGDSYAENVGLSGSIRSMVNLNNDSSNKERLNRWKCAYRMTRDRPWGGFGPGTFQFEYPRYQVKEQRTYMSVDGPLEDWEITKAWSISDQVFIRANPQIHRVSGGTAHSEYLLTASESGVIVLLLQLALFAGAFFLGFRCLVTATVPSGPLLYAVLALLAYVVHGLFNNYLDDCKIAFLVHGTLAIIVRSDVERRRLAKTGSGTP